MFRSLLCVAFAAVASQVCATVQPTLDLELKPYGGYGSYGIGLFWGQSYPVGITGDLVAAEILAGVVSDDDGAAIKMYLTRMRDNLPSVAPEDILAASEAYLPPPSPSPYGHIGFQWVRFDFPPTRVKAGEQLAFAWESYDTTIYWSAARRNDVSHAFVGGPDNFRWWETSWYDGVMYNYAFRTYVIPVPEPHVYPLVSTIIALACLGMRRPTA